MRRIGKVEEGRKISALVESCLKTNYWYLQSSEETSVADLDSMNSDPVTDPKPAFQVNPVPRPP
jgi:hypothetical protein